MERRYRLDVLIALLRALLSSSELGRFSGDGKPARPEPLGDLTVKSKCFSPLKGSLLGDVGILLVLFGDGSM